MLQKAFFKVDVVDRIYDTPVFEKTTPGNYSFIVPEEYNYVVIEYAGAAGGRAWSSDGAGINPLNGAGGKGSIKKQNIKLANRTISGIIGSRPTQTYESEYLGGNGYNKGENSYRQSVTIGTICGGGGGGSTSVIVNNSILEASAGAGAPYGTGIYGGKGGGQYGGARTIGVYNKEEIYNGNNATDPNQIGLNSGNGYVKIWAGYDPYLKG